MQQHAVTIVILAGGHATRLPAKLSRMVGGAPLLERVFDRLSGSGRPVLLSVRTPLPLPLSNDALSGVPTIVDAHGDVGPLGALASSAAAVKTPLMLVAAGDLPNIDSQLVDALEQYYHEQHEHDAGVEAVVPRHEDGRIEPLAALYDVAALRRASLNALEAGRLRVSDALLGMRVAYYPVTAPQAQWFVNVNTAEDLARIQLQ